MVDNDSRRPAQQRGAALPTDTFDTEPRAEPQQPERRSPVPFWPATEYGTLPPEIHSARMHSGPGARSFGAAAEAWDRLATQLADMAAGYGAVCSRLGWTAHDAAPIARGLADYTTWLSATAARARQAALCAKVTAHIHDSTFAATVAPDVIATNRRRNRALAVDNPLGQASVAIAEVDADYEQMWAQDAAAMYAYARASAAVAALSPFSSPPSMTDGGEPRPRCWALTAAPDVVATGSQVLATIPAALGALVSAPLTTLDTALSAATAPLSKLSSLSAPRDFAITHLNSLNKTAAMHHAEATVSRAGPTPTWAARGRAVSVGLLSVPQAWHRG
ncbi:PPE family protein [Mycobacterium sherrisii]|uniref:PPE family protein n=1 Tax=Mycobacterium sherrisii TaxID=243061 RepID=UPI000A146D3B|nr:PPE family protein [Mycobacterium sherrisii]MCV7032637.1 PPE family protein [Mycobacterium sherrisii]